MNISVQCCSIILLLWIIYMYKRSRRLPLKSTKAFKGSLYMTLISLLLDVASSLGIVYSDRLPVGVPELLCKTHVTSLLLVAMMAVFYVFSSVMHHLSSYKRTMLGTVIFSILEISLIYILPINVHYDQVDNLSWIDGPSTIVAYVGVGISIIFNLLHIHNHRKQIYDRQRTTVSVWMLMWLVAALLQYLNDAIMVVGFASVLGIVLVFIQFENPELYLDRTTGLFNVFAYLRYVEQLYSGGEDFSVVGISFAETPWQDDLQPGNSVEESQQLYNAFLKIPGAYVFKIQDNEIMLVFPKTEAAEYAWGVVTSQRHMPNIDALPSRPSIYYVPDPRCVNSPREILELIRNVSMRMSSSKEEIFHVIDSAMMEQIRAEHTTAQMIMDALNEDRIVVYYQPIYSVEKRCFNSAEALVRIVDREGNLIPPGAFIQAAEKNGMIIEIGKRVFEKVCRFFKQSRLEEYGIEYIEVNLSVVQCVNNKLADDYINIMKATQMDPKYINLEITESTSSHAKRTMISNMDRLINYGVNFSLDDFGTGASNLNYIVDMPVQIVKFDRGMLKSYFASGKAKYVMDAAMHMIHGMGLKIVAEGVETEEQYRKMEEIKINFIQGYYFSKPLPEEGFLEFMRQKNGDDLAKEIG